MAKRATKRHPARQKRTRFKGKTADTVAKPTKKTDWVGITALILTVIFGILATVVIPQITKERRELVYAINPIRTTVVSADACSPDLRVSYRGVDLGCVDITGAHVAIWNEGNVSIRQDNIRKDVVIFTEPEVQILDAKLRGLNNNKETGFAIVYDEELWEHGRIGVSWNLLEGNEGDSIQITYLGLPSVNIYVDGKIEGCGAVKRINLGPDSNQGKSWTDLYKSQKQADQIWLYSFVLTIVVTLLVGIAWWRGFIIPRGWQRKVRLLFPLCLLWLYVGLLYFVTPKFVHWPPFGF
jgi:hypothetical protein